MQRDVFYAIADPTRRRIIHMLAGKSMPVNDVANRFEISRPAVSKHIRILEECGLVAIRKKGRQRYCRAELHRLKEVSEWAERYRKFWSGKLDALENYLADEDEKQT